MTATAQRERQRKSLLQLETLVLNSDMRPLSTWPLSIISATDAVHGILRNRLAPVENWAGAVFHSPSIEVPAPKVVMLREYADVDAAPKFCRRSIFLRDRYRCQFCGERFHTSDLTFDHYVPRSKGGKTTWDNVLTACEPCNTRKKNGFLPALRLPYRPTHAELLAAGLELLPNDLREDFGSWLYWQTELQE